jgi:hypothetical protein
MFRGMNKVASQLVSEPEFQAVGAGIGQSSRQFRSAMGHEVALFHLKLQIELLDGQLRLIKWIGSLLIMQTWVVVLVKLL